MKYNYDACKNKREMGVGGKNRVYDNCPYKATIEEWDDDDGDIIALLCENCPDRDECSEKDYDVREAE